MTQSIFRAMTNGMSVTYPCDADPNPQFPSCSSDGFFERDAQHILSALSTHPGVASEKALASSGNNRAAPSDSGEIMNVLEELPKRFQASIGNCCAFPKNGVL